MGGYKWNSKKEELQVEFDYALKRYNEMRRKPKFKRDPELLVPYIEKINTILKLQGKYDFGNSQDFGKSQRSVFMDIRYLRKLR